MEKITVATSAQVELIDITGDIQKAVSKTKVEKGVCMVFVPHTTAGITINENADPSVKADIIKELNKIIPFSDNYAHNEGNSAAHIKASLLGFSLSVIVENGSLQLGTWQGICFAEFDGPRTRQVWIDIRNES
ncbi:MAG: secondary thiamine-phosphate synthase enzyme YjbQ [Candidatus Omnitrophica bacterium]|nr:secondary thiamine-phosphate synthase enzyme YjbQ [Candidatus Omnitrophota bacterium]MBU1925367.1 secondary thiamine-phosphate synthase enzyme YjbQ [Candidatus Omnitrophota bacterium]MBU2063585.1 secondary thiamine-phosphate synthase enzyme YjbQ [Candidatus Omnitrophota bacterium]